VGSRLSLDPDRPGPPSSTSRLASLGKALNVLLGPEPADGETHLWPRWVFLRALGGIYLSVFYSLAFQIHGLVGDHGLLPARDYLASLDDQGLWRLWRAPSLLWLSTSQAALSLLVAAGLAASLLLLLNLWPRTAILGSGALFLSFVAVARDFAAYQSDGMLLAASLVAFFLAPPGRRPGLGASSPPSPLSRWLLLWEWFRIYFESGLAKLLSGDPEWRTLTAIDHYYENGPLPTWIGWWAQQLPHVAQAATALLVLAAELVVVWGALLPRRARIACFAVTSVMQLGILATANYTFLNYLVLALGVLMLDDRVLARSPPPPAGGPVGARPWRLALAGGVLGWHGYATLLLFPLFPLALVPRPLLEPVLALQPFRVANRYGLFAVMTEARYEIEFQGSRDGESWVAYPFRYKPQDPKQPPGIFAPYQPRFDWNLWFVSLGDWRQNPWVVTAEERLLQAEPTVLALFAGDPFPGRPPRYLRAVLWQYWFTDLGTRRRTGRWWRREPRGLYAPALERLPDGSIEIWRAAEPAERQDPRLD
jgi:Lipase maturation factor